MRRKSRAVKIGNVTVGGGAPISVQSMAKTDTKDVARTVRQIRALEKEGCEIIRVAVQDKESACALARIKKKVHIPVVADIHFNYRLAIDAIKNGADCVRLNPGNIYRQDEIKKVVGEAAGKHIPIRIGVNSGSVKPKNNARSVDARTMVESSVRYMRTLEKLSFRDIIISLKASSVPMTIKAYELMGKACDYPFHLGVTAAGSPGPGAIKSAVGIGALLCSGIGDTIRVSLTGNPKEEVRTAYGILASLGLREKGPDIISCPTCGRCRVNLIKIVKEAEKQLKKLHLEDKLTGVKVAIMGCPVNGPGEAREADIGIACGSGAGALFKKGRITRKVSEKNIVSSLISELQNLDK